MYTVTVRKYEDDSLIKSIGSSKTSRSLMRVRNGLDINLDHEHYYTDIEDATKIRSELLELEKRNG